MDAIEVGARGWEAAGLGAGRQQEPVPAEALAIASAAVWPGSTAVTSRPRQQLDLLLGVELPRVDVDRLPLGLARAGSPWRAGGARRGAPARSHEDDAAAEPLLAQGLGRLRPRQAAPTIRKVGRSAIPAPPRSGGTSATLARARTARPTPRGERDPVLGHDGLVGAARGDDADGDLGRPGSRRARCGRRGRRGRGPRCATGAVVGAGLHQVAAPAEGPGASHSTTTSSPGRAANPAEAGRRRRPPARRPAGRAADRAAVQNPSPWRSSMRRAFGSAGRTTSIVPVHVVVRALAGAGLEGDGLLHQGPPPGGREDEREGLRPAASSGGEGSDKAGRTAVRVPVERVTLAAATTWIPATRHPVRRSRPPGRRRARRRSCSRR